MRRSRTSPALPRSLVLILGVVLTLLGGILTPVSARADLQLPCFPATAGEMTATITFEDCVPQSGLVTTQYSDGVHGLQLGSAVDLGFTFPDGTKGDLQCVGLSGPTKLESVPDGYRMHSPSSVLTAGATGCAGGEFSTAAILVRCPTVCLSLSGYLGTGSNIGQMSFSVKGFNSDGLLVASSTVDQQFLSAGGATVPFAVAPTGPDRLQWVLIRVQGSAPLWLDDLAYSNDPAAAPAFAVTKDAYVPSVVVSPSSTQSESLHLNRSNGSTGTVTFTATGLPPGVTATFNPPSFTGTSVGATVVTFAAAGGTTVSPPVDVTLAGDASGVPSTGTGSGVVQSISVALTVAFPLGLSRPFTVTCTPQSRNLRVATLPDFSGDVVVSAQILDNANQPILTPGWGVTVTPATLSFTSHSGTRDVALSWSTPTDLPPTGAWLRVTSTVVGHPTDSNWIEMRLIPDPPSITVAIRSAVPPIGVPGLGAAQVATVFMLTGAGFCAGTTVTFGNDLAAAPLVAGASLSQTSGPDLRQYTVTTPSYATSGRLTLRRIVGSPVDAGAVTSRTYRNTNAFSFHNYPVNDLVYDDMVRAFGHDQMYDSVNLCYPFDCTITFRDPLAMIWTAIVRSETVGTSGSGHCYGISVTNLRLLSGALDVASYPHGAATVYGLTKSPALTAEIQAAHLQQFSVEMIGAELDQASPGLLGSTVVLARLKAALAKGPAVVALRDGLTDGHVVVAYALEDLGGGQFAVDLYDNNKEYLATEDSDTSGVTHVGRQDGSRIYLDANGWSYDMGSSTWGGAWLDPFAGIMVLPYSFVAQKMHIPSLSNLSALASSLVSFGSPGDAGVASASPVTPVALPIGAVPLSYGGNASGGLFAVSGTQRLSLRATADAPYQVSVVGRGGGTSVMTSARTGTVDSVVPLTGGLSLTTATAKAMTLTNAFRAAKSVLATTMSATGGAGSTTFLRVSGGVLSAGSTSGGPVSFTTSSTSLRGSVAPQTRRFVVTLAPGDSLRVVTAALSVAGPTLSVSVTHGGVSRVVRVKATTVAVATVRPLALVTSVSRGHGIASARVLIRTVAKGTQGTVTVSVFAKGKRIATRSVTCRVCRVGSLAAAVPWLARRGTYTIEVTLVLSQGGVLTGQVSRVLRRVVTVR